jgi:hypothetical protein
MFSEQMEILLGSQDNSFLKVQEVKVISQVVNLFVQAILYLSQEPQ